MACILKIPSNNSKGVVTFTTQERDKFILPDEDVQKKIKEIKDKWVIGLHHNWHDFNFSYNPLFDFSMAGETDLIEKDGKDVPVFPMDACNFSPEVFHFNKNEKFWDILYVARAVFFKKIPEFFKVIRALYDEGKMYRVLLISPIPQECKDNCNDKTMFCDIREVYESMFSQNEQKFFTLLTTNYKNSFPFDIPSLAQFYKNSKVFVHSADDERRCRVVGYAMATGMPIVCMDAPASLFPKRKQYKPLLYKAETYNDFPMLIKEAISFVDSEEYSEESMKVSIEETSEVYTTDYLVVELAKYYSEDNTPSSKNLFNLNNLDIRLGRHHGLGQNENSIGWSVKSFLRYLKEQKIEDLKSDINQLDLEQYITSYSEFGQVHKNSLWHEPKKKIDYNESFKVYLINSFPKLHKLYKSLKGVYR